MPPLLQLQKLLGMEGEKKVPLHPFLADQKIVSLWGKNVFWGILVTACCQTHSDYGPPKMSLKLAV